MGASGKGRCWVLLLAGGEGSRLRSLTTTRAGISIPKQFCSLQGGASLLHETLERAESIAPRKRICTVVAAQHECWWRESLRLLPRSNVIVQPSNCGTASGILLPLLKIARTDPQAKIVILPSDHHIEDEKVLAVSVRAALAQLDTHPQDIVLMGIEPEDADPELGYIVPAASAEALAPVLQFVEKPTPEEAAKLIRRGALWNAFIIAACAPALLRMYERCAPDLLARMRAAIDRKDPNGSEHALRTLYEHLAPLDFSRDICRGQEESLKVFRVPACGWSDLGTPKRVIAALDRIGFPAHRAPEPGEGPAPLNLAAEHQQRREWSRGSPRMH